jgi:serine protease Do
VRVKLRRGEEEVNVTAVLTERQIAMSDRAIRQNMMGGELSRRALGFDSVLQHDTVLRPADVGGPIVDLDGHVVGINIARAGRVESYALPAATLGPLIEALRSGEHPAVYAARPQPTTREQ